MTTKSPSKTNAQTNSESLELGKAISLLRMAKLLIDERDIVGTASFQELSDSIQEFLEANAKETRAKSPPCPED